MSQLRWAQYVWLVRHGESLGNVARAAAEASGKSLIKVPMRDMDVPLSQLGEKQAAAVGVWFGALSEDIKPTTILSSPYVRAYQTADILKKAANLSPEIIRDERLREREFGIFDRLTKEGVRRKHPEQFEARTVLGKFYHRPPGGESWCDVLLRLRSVLDDLRYEYGGERVLIVAHDVIVICFRYLLENMREEDLLQCDQDCRIANCSVTSYRLDKVEGRRAFYEPQLCNFVEPLADAGAPVTDNKDAPVAVK